MDVPSKCTIVRAIDGSAYSSGQNSQKKQLRSVSVKKALSKGPYIVRKLSVSSLISSVTNSYNNRLSCAHL